MYSRWYNVTVVLLWLAAMTWLTVVKVLPPLLIGEPPSNATILAARMREPPVAWELYLEGERIGWALCTIDALPHELTEIRSRVHFERLPLRQIVPEWLAAMLQPLEGSMGRLQMDTESMVIIDPLRRLSQVESAIWFDPMKDAIRMRGTVEDNRLKVEIRAGGEKIGGHDVYLPSDALLGDALSPQTHLPGLRKGQTWTVEVYSPLRPPSGPLDSPLEILAAEVDKVESIRWNGRAVDTWRVVYRSDRGAELGGTPPPRGRAWVRCRDGTVLKQQATIFNSTMTFVRLPDDQTRSLAESAPDLE